jgi:DNA gyrase subunit B
MSKPAQPAAYTADSIQVLEGLEAVRMRPGMYIGGTDIKALHHMVFEVVDNAVDEAMAGECDRIDIVIRTDESVMVRDNGRGIPVDLQKQTGVSALETVMTKLHAGGKFGGGGYKVSGGLHGVGVSAVNALSTWLEAEVRRDGWLWRQRFERGIPQGPVQKVRKLTAGETRGTTITFLRDDTIFVDDRTYRFESLQTRLREMAFLTRGLRVYLRDEREEPPHESTFYFEGGVRSFVRYLNRGREALHPVIHCSRELDGTYVEAAWQYTDLFTDNTYTFANTIITPDGGVHLTGFRAALTRVLNDYGRKQAILKDADANLSGDDTREGITAIVSVKLPDPQFESQTKVKLLNADVRNHVESAVGEAFSQWLDENPREARAIIDKCLTSARARSAARQARDLVIRKSVLESSTLPGKLADCSSREPEEAEIYIVEGDSAGGCFSGDTTVRLASGGSKSFADLAADWDRGVMHHGYATNAEGDVRLVPLLHPRRTRISATLVEVELDNGERMHCTPDHLFRLRDGSYCRADQLAPDTSLMALKTRVTDRTEAPAAGYEMVWMHGHEAWWHTHHLADQFNLRAGIYARDAGRVRHHVDFDKRNNDPRNILRMSDGEHLRIHREAASFTFTRMWQNPDYRARKLAQLSAAAKRQWQDPAYRQQMTERARALRTNADVNARIRHGFLAWYRSLSPDAVAAYRERMREAQASYWSDPAHRTAQAERVRARFDADPSLRAAYALAARDQWSDPTLRSWRSGVTRRQWLDPAYRARHAEDVRTWWADHPEHRAKIVAARRAGWADPAVRERIEQGLAAWRTDTPRAERVAMLRAGHRQKAIRLLNTVLGQASHGDVRAEYEALRRSTAPTSLRYDTLLQVHFGGDEARLVETAANYNMRVVAVRALSETADVYDLTVENYHNFALEAGPFVHNSAKQGRDRRFQAILPLRGKILNVEKSRLDKILNNNEIRTLVQALGVGLGDDSDLEGLRYGRVIIMTDADVDGSHIRTLLLTFFFRYMPHLIESGHLFIAQPPLYLVKSGRSKTYAYTEAEKDRLVKRGKSDNAHVQRYKGLGEMNPEQLWETTMNPENRSLLQVNIEDAAMAHRTFEMLMGSDVPPRRKFIQTHAKDVKNLDV